MVVNLAGPLEVLLLLVSNRLFIPKRSWRTGRGQAAHGERLLGASSLPALWGCLFCMFANSRMYI